MTYQTSDAIADADLFGKARQMLRTEDDQCILIARRAEEISR